MDTLKAVLGCPDAILSNLTLVVDAGCLASCQPVTGLFHQSYGTVWCAINVIVRSLSELDFTKSKNSLIIVRCNAGRDGNYYVYDLLIQPCRGPATQEVLQSFADMFKVKPCKSTK